MEGAQPVQVDVADAVAVGQEERLALQPALEQPDPSAGVCLDARLDEVDPPGLDRIAVLQLDLTAGEVDADGPAHGGVIQEVPADHVAEVPERHHELADAVVGVVLHDVPEDWAFADLDHRLRSDVGLLCEPRAEAARQDHGLHGSVL